MKVLGKWILVVILVVLVVVEMVEGSPRGGRGGGSGSGEEGRGQARLRSKHEWRRRNKKTSECRLGRQRYQLGEEWSPNLGPPFGTWSCVRCSCDKVRRKRRFVGRVRCRNIKTECPKVTCAAPVILPGACCKTCPGDTPHDATPTLDLNVMTGDSGMQEELTGRDFAVLLNGRTSKPPMTTRRVATGRLFLRRRALHYSFLLETEMPHPVSVLFLNDAGDILEELEPQTSPYEVTNSRICGTWTRLPREYRTLLLDENMWVALAPPDSLPEEDVISGRVSRYIGVDTEVFSALLAPPSITSTSPSPPPPSLSGGGTAIISVDRQTDSLHISLVFNGIFASGENHNVTVKVQLFPERGVDPVTDTVILPKVFSDINRAQVRTTLGERSLIRLTRGQVEMRVWCPSAPHLELRGAIMPRATCNVFSAVLTPPPPQAQDSVSLSSHEGAGWALVTLENDGTFQYEIAVEGGAGGAVRLETKQRRRPRVVEDLTLSLTGGRANGTYERPTYRDLDALLRGRVQVIIDSEGVGRGLAGTLDPVAVTEALKSPRPTLLSTPGVDVAATVWVAVDAGCVTHYDVRVGGTVAGTGVEREPEWSLVLREDDQSWDPRHEMTTLQLEDRVEGWEVFAHSTRLSTLSLSRLKSGVTHLDLHLLPPPNSTISTATLSGRVSDVQVPDHCLFGSDVREVIVRTSEQCGSGPCFPLDAADPPPVINTCVEEVDGAKRVLEDGTSWPQPMDPCRMCMCSRGKITCQDVVCHDVECANPVTPSGHCCPVCPGEDTEEESMCEMNNQKHPLGSKWHPFLAPIGFDKCVSCTCVIQNGGTPNVNCSRHPCPPLPCGLDEMDHQEGSCCSVCRTPSPAGSPPPTASPGVLNEGAQVVSMEEHREMVLGRGGCRRNNLVNSAVYENGAEWHPRVTSIGYYNCVTCKCKDGSISCVNQKCPTLHCTNMIKHPRECCPRCGQNTTLSDSIHPTRLRPHQTSRHHPHSRRRGRKPYKKGHKGGGRRTLNSG